MLFNIGQCQRQLGQYAAAAHSYRAYLAQAPDGGDRAAAERLAAQMDAAGVRVARAPARATAPENTSQRVEIKSPTGGADRLGGRARRRRWLAAGLGIGGVGLALAITGGALLGVGAGDDAAARGASTLSDQRRLWDAGEQLQAAGIATLATGGVAIVVGTIVAARRRR